MYPPNWGPVELICPSVRPVVHAAFWWSEHASCNCVQSMRLQATVPNPLNGSIICPSIHPPSRPRAFLRFLYLYKCIATLDLHTAHNYGPRFYDRQKSDADGQTERQTDRHISSTGPHWGPSDPSVGINFQFGGPACRDAYIIDNIVNGPK